MTYESPQALSRALRDRAKREAARTGTVAGDLLNRFYFERLLARVFRHDQDGWLLKGGQAMLVRYRDVRHSRDIDLCRTDATSLAEAVTAIRSAAALDLNDHLRFEYRGRTDLAATATVRVSFDVLVGTRTEAVVKVDLVARPCPSGDLRPLKPSVPIDWPDDWPVVRLYPIVAHVADKVCALYERHNGRASTRYRDLVDLVVMARRDTMQGQALQNAIALEYDRRRAAGTELHLPAGFELPDHATWTTGYEREARTVAAMAGYRTVGEATELMKRFLDPVLTRSDPGMWVHDESRWKPITR